MRAVVTAFFGLVLLGIIPSALAAQARLAGPRIPSAPVTWRPWDAAAGQGWGVQAQSWLAGAPDSLSGSRADHSAAKIVAIHTAVGAGTGLVLGYLMSRLSFGNETEVILTWTAVGASAGVIGGVVAWLIGRPL
jgi:hypothetical protein